MVVNGIKLDFSKIVNNEIEKEINIVLIKEDREYTILPDSEDEFMLIELSGKEDISYSIIDYDDIVWTDDTELELHGSKYKVSPITVKALSELTETEIEVYKLAEQFESKELD